MKNHKKMMKIKCRNSEKTIFFENCAKNIILCNVEVGSWVTKCSLEEMEIWLKK